MEEGCRLEHLFGDQKQDLRRRLGRAHLARDLQQQPAQAALILNLRHPDYVRVLCGSLENLPAAFAALDGVAVAGATSLWRDHRDHALHRRVNQLLGRGVSGPERKAADSQDDRSAPAPPDDTPPLSALQGLTEEQLRARCANIFAPPRDPRLPPTGAILTRVWQGVEHSVRVVERGFEYQGQTYTSLAPIARRITDGRFHSGASFLLRGPRQDGDKPPRLPRSVGPTYRLGSLVKRYISDMKEAGCTASTISA